ncbi:MAG: beta strand repeat-containing protein, partial [Thermodesulfovibrionales bacterium]
MTILFEASGCLKQNGLKVRHLFIVFGIIVGLILPASALAAVDLTVTPLTWNVVGLDSNSPASGPNRFPVGVRVCSSAATADVTVNFVWDSSNANINLRPGSLSAITIPSLAAGGCSDAYFEVEVTRDAAAYDTVRRYHITATDASGTASTPTPREIYVEHLVSQSRNGITTIRLNGVDVPAGGSMSLMVGNTYLIELDGFTATQGYNQLESFINFPNTIFQVLSVSTTYSSNTSPYVSSPNDKLYADACLWASDPNSPNYRSCIGGDYKSGGSVTTTYTVKILSGGGTSESLYSLLYDFSGSSYHYNADYSVGARIANIIDPASAGISKTFSPDPTSLNGISALTITISNPNPGTVSGYNFTDTLPANMTVAATPGATTSGCGTPIFAPTAGASSISFSNGTLAANSSCVIKVNVTPSILGALINTTDHLFVGAVDTGNYASATLTVNADPPPGSGVCGVTMARWNFPSGMSVTAPLPTTANVTASASAGAGMSSPPIFSANDNTISPAGTGSWGSNGSITTGATLTTANNEYFEFALDTTGYSSVYLSFDSLYKTPNGPKGLAVYYGTSNSRPETGTAVYSNANAMSSAATWFSFGAGNSIAFTTGLNPSGTTYFRIYAFNSGNTNAGSDLNIDNVLLTGCRPAVKPTISKSFSPSPVAANGISTLTFTLTNTDTVQLTGAKFTDTLPAGLQVAATPAAGTTCTGGPTWSPSAGASALDFGQVTGANIPAGGSCTASVNITATTSGPHNNVSGFLSTAEGGTNTGIVASSTLTAILPPSMSKLFAPAPILAGSVSTLTFRITNPNQNDPLNDVAFSDTFPIAPGNMVVANPPNASLSDCGSPTFSPVAGAGSIAFSGGIIAGGGVCTVTVDVTASSTGTFNNTSGNVSHIINGSPENGNAASASITVNPPNPALAILKQVAPAAAGPWTSFLALTEGSTVYYRFTIENTGDVPLSPVSITDDILDVSSCNAPWSSVLLPVAVAANDNHIISCIVGPITAISGSHLNTAYATGIYGGAPEDSANSVATYATTGLTIAKSATEGSFTAAGDVVHYNFLVTNNGFAPLAGPVTVSDDKSGDELCPALSTVGDLDDYLDPGESITCTASYTVTAADVTAKSVTNVASATAAGVTSQTATKTVYLAPDLMISKSDGGSSAVPGGTIAYTLSYSNIGGQGAAGVLIAETVPADTTFNAGASTAGWSCANGSPGGTACTLTIGGLAAGGSGLVTFAVTVVNPVAAGVVQIANTATIADDGTNGGDPTPGNNSGSDTTPVDAAPDLTISKSDGGVTAVPGGTIAYTLSYSNVGNQGAAGVVITETVPADTTFNAGASTAGWSCANGSAAGTACTFTVGGLTAGGIGSVTFAVTVLNPVAAGVVQISNTSAIADDGTNGGDPTPGNNSGSDTTPVDAAPDLTISKSDGGVTAVPGGTIAYTLS